MKIRSTLPILCAALAAAGLVTDDADACGGCFAPPTESTVVSGHRMAVAIASSHTVLWDQIQYSGNPKEFAWVLPVKPGARIELAADAWFEALDAATTVRVTPPQLNCGTSGGGMGCGADSGASLDLAFAPRSADVTVIHQGTVGPYETVTLGADKPGALNAWLEEHGYGIDPATQPVVDAYVAEGFDFIALRLLPSEGIKDMKPVRVITPGASPALPLRMVAAGTGAEVSLVLFVIGEGRWEPKNFPSAHVPVDLIAWDFADQSSNYGELRKVVMEAQDGRSWITPYAHAQTLLSPFSGPGAPRQYVTSSGAPAETIGAAYVQQALDNGETTDTTCLSSFAAFADSSQVVVDPCPAGAKPTDPACKPAGSDLDRRELICDKGAEVPLDDLAVALTGMHPKDVWLTRLEANLPHAALRDDLDLQAASAQDMVDNQLQARIAVHREAQCPAGAVPFLDDGKSARSRGLTATVGLLCLALAAAIARRRPAWLVQRPAA